MSLSPGARLDADKIVASSSLPNERAERLRLAALTAGLILPSESKGVLACAP